MTTCPVCGAGAPAPFLVRTPVPVHQNLIVREVAAARALLRGTLSLRACEACGFVFNSSFDPALLNYSAAYDNTQSCSPAFEAYVEGLARRLVDERGVRNSRIVEVGCGKGGFLRALVRHDPGNHGVGYDPSYVGPDSEAGGRLRFERRFYDERCADPGVDVIVCRHVIEHVADPVALLRSVRRALGDGDARVFFETPCVEWILANEVLWDFFYEHCSYFTVDSLGGAFERAGFSVDAITHTFGGQYLWAEARPAAAPPVPRAVAGRIPALARRFAEQESSRIRLLRLRLESLAEAGPVAMWGAAAKGVTLANLVDPDCQLIACIVDLNPSKQGGRLPGSGHPIVSVAGLAARGVRTAVVTNPNYMNENVRLLREAALDVRLVDLMHLDEEVDAHRH